MTRPPDSDELLDYYRRRVPEYDEVYRKPERQEDLRALRRLVAKLLSGHRVLEVACGTGYWTDVFAQTARSVVATDLEATALAVARQRCARSPGVTFLQADAWRLETVPGEFSAAFVGFWCSHVPRQNLDRFFESLHRRLGPGARVVTVDNRFVPGSNTPTSERDGNGNTWQTRRLADGSEHRVIKNFPDESELRRAVGVAGREIELHCLPHYWCLTYEVGTPPPAPRAPSRSGGS